MNQLNTKNKFTLQLHRKDEASPSVTIAESSSFTVFKKMVELSINSKPIWNNDPNLYIRLTTPDGITSDSYAKNKTTAFNDLIKILKLE